MTNSLRFALLGLIPAGLLAAPPENRPHNPPLKVEVQNFPEFQDVALDPCPGQMLKAGQNESLSIPLASHVRRALPGVEMQPASGQQVAEDLGQPPDLPPLESLTADSDYSAFMQAGVSPDLRREALRRLFQSGKYGALDPLDPYRADYGNYT